MPTDGTPSEPFERYRAYLIRLARQQLGPPGRGDIDPSDVVQDVLLKACQHWDECRGSDEAQRLAWLRQILANTLIDRYRRLRREAGVHSHDGGVLHDLDQSSMRLENLLPADQSTPSSVAVKHERLLRLSEALAQLPERQQAAIELRYLREPRWSLAAIAGSLNCTEKAAAGLVCHGLENLRKLMIESR